MTEQEIDEVVLAYSEFVRIQRGLGQSYSAREFLQMVLDNPTIDPSEQMALVTRTLASAKEIGYKFFELEQLLAASVDVEVSWDQLFSFVPR